MFLCLSLPVAAADIPLEFESPVQQQRYQHLLEELRCLVCQNQSLADSNADLAQDLRTEVYQMIVDGKDDEEITGFLVNRYGDFVLYRPPVKGTTWLLWFAPFLLLIIAIILVVVIARSRSAAVTSQLNAAEQERLSRLFTQEQHGVEKQ